MKKFLRTSFFLIIPTLLPLSAFALGSTFRDFSDVLVRLLRNFVSLIFASMSVGLLYGVVLYMMNSDNDKKREEIKPYLLWGVIGITVAFGLWGILAILSDTLGWGGVGIPIIRPPA